jgi:hypothetical protein
MAHRHASIVDAHVLLRRDGKILLLRRAPGLYAAGQLCLPSVHLASRLSELLLSALLLAVGRLVAGAEVVWNSLAQRWGGARPRRSTSSAPKAAASPP